MKCNKLTSQRIQVQTLIVEECHDLSIFIVVKLLIWSSVTFSICKYIATQERIYRVNTPYIHPYSSYRHFGFSVIFQAVLKTTNGPSLDIIMPELPFIL